MKAVYTLVVSLFILMVVAGCSPISTSIAQSDSIAASSTHVATSSTPLCPPHSRYQVGSSEIGKPVSECNLYFYVDTLDYSSEKYIRVVIQPNKPIVLQGALPMADNQILPYWYRWVIKDEQGQTERAWLAYFIKNRDGIYHTIVTQPDQDWQKSFIEVYFEDVNGDGVREDVTYEIAVKDFLETKSR